MLTSTDSVWALPLHVCTAHYVVTEATEICLIQIQVKMALREMLATHSDAAGNAHHFVPFVLGPEEGS